MDQNILSFLLEYIRDELVEWMRVQCIDMKSTEERKSIRTNKKQKADKAFKTLRIIHQTNHRSFLLGENSF